jgi:hypothetical protein
MPRDRIYLRLLGPADALLPAPVSSQLPSFVVSALKSLRTTEQAKCHGVSPTIIHLLGPRRLPIELLFYTAIHYWTGFIAHCPTTY